MAIEVIKKDDKVVSAILKDVLVAYVRVAKPDTQIGGGEKYSVTCIVEDKEDVKLLKTLSKTTITTIEGDEANSKYNTNTTNALVYVIKYKANTITMKDGPDKGKLLTYESPFRPKVYDKDGNDITMTTMIGNGSRADIKIRFGIVKKYGDEANAYLDKVTITNLVKLEPKTPIGNPANVIDTTDIVEVEYDPFD